MNRLFKTFMIALLLVGTACTGQAQGDEEKKIKVKITKQVDGETKTFEGEYVSEEEMLSDPEYREFAGDGHHFRMAFSGDTFDKMIQLHGAPGMQTFSFDFDDEDMPGNMMKRFHMGQGGPGAFMFDDEAIARIHMFDSEEYEKKMEEKMKALEEKMKGLDKTLQEDIMKSMREIEEMNAGMIPRMTKRGGITVEDAGDDFGKRGVVESKDKLELENVNYMVMHKRLNLRFSVPSAGELSVKISNEAGKELYNRYFEKFNGTFSDEIDFNQYSSGKYLLEIAQDKKRLTKKLVVE